MSKQDSFTYSEIVTAMARRRRELTAEIEQRRVESEAAAACYAPNAPRRRIAELRVIRALAKLAEHDERIDASPASQAIREAIQNGA